MAAINAAGYDAGLDSPSNHPLRNEIRTQLANRHIPSLAGIKEFYTRHKRQDPGQDLAQYISFALICAGPPGFSLHRSGVAIPPDVDGMDELSPLLAQFFKEADIPTLWKKSQGDIDHYIDRYHNQVADTVLQVNVYLRQQTSGYRGRRFQIFLELLAAPNQVQARTYGNEDYIVISPSSEPHISEIRHAYLRYLLDPMATHYREMIERKKALADHLERARALPSAYRDDFLQVTTESLIRAVESRLDHKPQMVQQALLEGFILTPYFSESLVKFEKGEQSISVYYPDMIGSIDMVHEDERLMAVQFNAEPPPPPAAKPKKNAPPPPQLTGVDKTLDDAEVLYLTRNTNPANQGKAKELFLEALNQTPEKPKQAAAYYGLARIALLEKAPQESETLFNKVLTLDPEPPVKAWTLVYLGKLSFAAEDKEAAAKFFQSALQVDGASAKAREEAQKGVEQTSSK
jgi:tetratricopeptide (TPR) repeat protein